MLRFIEKPRSEGWISAGFFVFERKVFDYLGGDECVLEREPLERLAADGQLMAYRHEGFFYAMDTYPRIPAPERALGRRAAPWKLWEDTPIPRNRPCQRSARAWGPAYEHGSHQHHSRRRGDGSWPTCARALPSLNGATLLVTGAGGFLCSHFLETIAVFNETARPGCRVLAVDNFKTGLPERLAWMAGRRDMELRPCDVSPAIRTGRAVDLIIHGAGIASPPVYRRFPLETIDVNVNGARHMLELLRRRGRGMLLLSSSEIYGDPDAAHIPTSEDFRGYVSSTGPRACYDESKRLAETLAMTYYRLYGVARENHTPIQRLWTRDSGWTMGGSFPR